MLGAAQLVCRCSREPPVLRNGAETMRRLCTIGRSSGAGVDDAAADFVAGRTHRPAVAQGLNADHRRAVRVAGTGGR